MYELHRAYERYSKDPDQEQDTRDLIARTMQGAISSLSVDVAAHLNPVRYRLTNQGAPVIRGVKQARMFASCYFASASEIGTDFALLTELAAEAICHDFCAILRSYAEDAYEAGLFDKLNQSSNVIIMHWHDMTVRISLVRDLQLQREPGPYYLVFVTFHYVLSGDLPKVPGEWPTGEPPDQEQIMNMIPKRFLHAGFWD